MDAMILAAGLGTRLQPLTDRMPKALVEVGGAPLLEHVARRLIACGVDRLVVNVHHFAAEIEQAILRRRGFGVEVLVSREEERPLETGGGLRRAAPLLRRDAPFFVHNADVLTELPLGELYGAHAGSGALATVAVMERDSQRALLFDDRGLLGRVDEGKAVEIRVREPEGEERRLAFAGVHVVEPRMLDSMVETGAFPILDPYLRLAAEGERIQPYRVDGYPWFDIGKPEQLEAARRWMDGGSGG
jgi:N-acetyl-alpha-D-muramate 1-phosphate uridylyltransferase